jgi:hypothetical protein
MRRLERKRKWGFSDYLRMRWRKESSGSSPPPFSSHGLPSLSHGKFPLLCFFWLGWTRLGVYLFVTFGLD